MVAAVNLDGKLATALSAGARQGILDGLVRTAEANPDMGEESRADLVRELCPGLPDVAVRRIALRTVTFGDVLAVAGSPRLAEMSAGRPDAEVLAAVDAVLAVRLRPADPSPEAVIIAWAGGLLHARQAARAMNVRGFLRQAAPPADVHRWDQLERLAAAASPRLTARVADLARSDRQAMAEALLAEAAAIIGDPASGAVERVAAAQAAHRTRSDLADEAGVPAVQRRLAADLEALGETSAAFQVAAEALDEWPPDGDPADREWLAAAFLRLNQRTPSRALTPLAEALITAGAAVGLEARLWAAIALLNIPGRRDDALTMTDEVTADLDQRGDLGTAGDQWRLLLAFHAGRAGQPAITGRLLAPLLTCGDNQREDAAVAVLRACAGQGADTRRQNIILEAELAALPPDAADDRLHIYYALSRNYDALGDYRQALTHGQYELALRLAIQPPDHPDILVTRNNIAGWTGECGDADQALRLFQLLLPDQERVLGPDHPDTLTTRNNIAGWTGDSGDAERALRLSELLLPDQERVLGPDHPDTLTTRNNIALWTGRCGDAAGALRLSELLLPDQERVLGLDHPDTLTTRHNIAGWTGECGDAARALRLSRLLLPDQERALGPDHPDTLTTRNNIAFLTRMGARSRRPGLLGHGRRMVTRRAASAKG